MSELADKLVEIARVAQPQFDRLGKIESFAIDEPQPAPDGDTFIAGFKLALELLQHVVLITDACFEALSVMEIASLVAEGMHRLIAEAENP